MAKLSSPTRTCTHMNSKYLIPSGHSELHDEPLCRQLPAQGFIVPAGFDGGGSRLRTVFLAV